jgi:hypothetical protein
MKFLRRFMMISVLFCSAACLAQDMNPKAPLTKIEDFLTTTGTFVETDFYDIGKIGCKGSEDLILSIITVSLPQEDRKISGVVMNIFSVEKFKSMLSHTLYIDYSDIHPLKNALELMNAKADSLKNTDTEHKVIKYKLVNGVEFGFIHERGQTKSSQEGFCDFNDWDPDAYVRFGLNRFPELIKAFESAERKLKELEN